MWRALPLTGLSAIAFSLVGCRSPDSPPSGSSTACLVAGGPSPNLLRLSEREVNANVALTFAKGAEKGVCSGVVVGASAVLTAAHCVTYAMGGSVSAGGEPVSGAGPTLPGVVALGERYTVACADF